MVSNVTGLTPPLQLAELYCVFERREEKIYHWKFFYYRSSEFAFGSLRDCRFCPPPQKKTHLCTHWVWRPPKAHQNVRIIYLGGLCQWRLTNWLQKEPKYFIWPLKKCVLPSFFKGQRKYFGSFCNQLTSLHWYIPLNQFFWTFRWALGAHQTQCAWGTKMPW